MLIVCMRKVIVIRIIIIFMIMIIIIIMMMMIIIIVLIFITITIVFIFVTNIIMRKGNSIVRASIGHVPIGRIQIGKNVS